MLAIKVVPRQRAIDVINTSEARLRGGIPQHIRFDHAPKMTATRAGLVIQRRAKTLYIEPASPRENGYHDSFNGKLRDEWLNGEIFYY